MPTQITLNQLLIVGIIVGFVIGLVPLILGFKNQKLKFGVIGFVLTLIGGVFFSLLGALPVAAIFSWLILRKPKVDEAEPGETTNETPIDAPIKTPENL